MSPFQSLRDYEEYIYTLKQRFPSIQRSTLVVTPCGKRVAILKGELTFDQGYRLTIGERLSLDTGGVEIEFYGYELWHNNEVTTKYVDGLRELLKDPEEAAAYLNAALEEDSQEAFLLALRDVAEARGMSQLAREANLNREDLYRILSATGNPQLSSLSSLLNNFGLRLAIQVDYAQG